MDIIEKWFREISFKKIFILCGDFNIDMLSQSTHCRRLKNICDDNGVNILVNSPTRITTESTTLIDLCVSNFNSNRISKFVKFLLKIKSLTIYYWKPQFKFKESEYGRITMHLIYGILWKTIYFRGGLLNHVT